MNMLDAWTIQKMKCKDICIKDKVHEVTHGRRCKDNVSFKDADCEKCFRKETGREA